MIASYAEIVDGIIPMMRMAAHVDDEFVDSMIAWLVDNAENRADIVDIARDMRLACAKTQEALGSCLAALDALASAKNRLINFGVTALR